MKQNYKEEQQENDLQAQVCVENPVTDAFRSVANGGYERERTSRHFSEDPYPASVAALEFQVAWLLNDSHSSMNWPGHGNMMINTPGELKKKYDNLCRIAKAHFPSRGDTLDVLNETVCDYGLGAYANPFGFWTAFKRDMRDAAKKAVEVKCVPFEKSSQTASDGIRSRKCSHAWQPSEGAHHHEKKQARQWLTQKYSEISATKTPAAQKWKNVIASDNPLDRLLVEAYNRVLTDKDVMEELASSEREVASLAPIVREIRLLTRCSQAKAYRILEKFRKRWADGATEKLGRPQYFREKGPPSVAMPIGGDSDAIDHSFRCHADQDRSGATLASHQIVHI
jgi:hypothetical protein